MVAVDLQRGYPDGGMIKMLLCRPSPAAMIYFNPSHVEEHQHPSHYDPAVPCCITMQQRGLACEGDHKSGREHTENPARIYNDALVVRGLQEDFLNINTRNWAGWGGEINAEMVTDARI